MPIPSAGFYDHDGAGNLSRETWLFAEGWNQTPQRIHPDHVQNMGNAQLCHEHLQGVSSVKTTRTTTRYPST
jgi:hypothetical protein